MSRIYQAAEEAERAHRQAGGQQMPPSEVSDEGPDFLWAGRNTVAEYERLRLALHSIPAAGPSRAVMICGATRGDGASSIAAGLAVASAAYGGATALLLDANLRNPDVHRRFHVSRSPGFANALVEDRAALQSVVNGPLADLYLLPAGGARVDPVAAYRSDRLATLLQELERTYDYVIVDAPPLNECPESSLLAQRVGGVVLVVRAERTRIEVAAAARDRLTACHAHTCGVVLNDRRYYIPEWIYRRL